MSKTINKADLIDAIANSANMSKADAARAIDAFTSSVIDAVSEGNMVTLIGFGSFDCMQSSARKGRNPQTGAVINIPASKRPRFKAGKNFKDAVNA